MKFIVLNQFITKYYFVILILLFYFISNFFSIFPHPSLNSSLEVDIYHNKVSINIKIPLEEIEKAIQTRISLKDIGSEKLNLKVYLLEHLHLKDTNGIEWKASLIEDIVTNSAETTDDPVDLKTIISFIPPNNNKINQFIIESDLVQREVLDHQIIVYLRKDWESGVFSDNPKIIGTIRFANNSLTIDRRDSSPMKGFFSTFKLGMHHIIEGYDHLFFLIMLLLPAPLIKINKSYEYKNKEDTFFYLFKIVSSFTVGHSLTLALGAIQIITPPLPLIEVIIAISVLISAINVLHQILYKTEFWIAGGFGLIHGLAFSSTVLEFGLHSTQLILSILGFNLGIEFIQFMIVLFCLPFMYMMIQSNIYILFKTLTGILGILFSLLWIYERIKVL